MSRSTSRPTFRTMFWWWRVSDVKGGARPSHPDNLGA